MLHIIDTSGYKLMFKNIEGGVAEFAFNISK
jgi:hypothetical protein